MPDPFRQIEVLRAHRGLPALPDGAGAGGAGGVAGLPLAGVFGAEARELRSRARSLGAAGSAFSRLVPQPIRERCTLVGVRAGVLSVRCDDAAAGFELDRWLRSGGELELIKAAPTMLTRVKRVGMGGGARPAAGARATSARGGGGGGAGRGTPKARGA